MGIPKFFRYISERYPLISQLVEENKVPEFDNFYLDFNAIIHHCSHPNDDDAQAHSRQTEEQIFSSIFRYVELLLGKIRPRKLFFVAVDGVAPRAKMNQQRSRRFRAAQDAQEAIARAEKSGHKISEGSFDSNCITPGTLFMSRLSERLKYFINHKITHDSNWREIQVVFSGPETPGEGEHKIMEYIRYSRAQPGYDPNTRHCLYGLDADLIMLGLLSHEPHFCLLREEIKFGFEYKARKIIGMESTKFYLLHLSLMREYLDIEFREVELTLSFKYSLENVIDDFILLAVFSGNDFLPDIPGFHIRDNGFEKLFSIYKRVLPTLDGYINKNGLIDLNRLQALFAGMATWDQAVFEKEHAYLGRFKKETQLIDNDLVNARTISAPSSNESEVTEECYYTPPVSVKAVSEVVDEKLREVASRFLDGFETRNKDLVQDKLDEWKRNYYKKLGVRYDDKQELSTLVFRYIEGLQWIMHYYFQGIVSWGWFYNYYHAPRASDLNCSEGMSFNFDLGEPFRPLEQLMGVLPPASRNLVPPAYHDLMSDVNSPIIDFYPTDFDRDSNGKKRPWEAVVKIPFIDEERLLNAMNGRGHRLTLEERERNGSAPGLIFKFSPEESIYPSPAPGLLKDIRRCRCQVESLNLVMTGQQTPLFGLCDGVRLGIEASLGFPSLQTLPHSTLCSPQIVNVHGSQMSLNKSKNNSILIKIENPLEGITPDEVATDMIGARVYVGWPCLWEGLVVGVSDVFSKFDQIGGSVCRSPNDSDSWRARADRIGSVYLTRRGVITGKIDVLIRVRPLKGLTMLEDGAFVKEYDEECSIVELPLQMCVRGLAIDDARFIETRPLHIQQSLLVGSEVIFLGKDFYGAMARVTSSTGHRLEVLVEYHLNDELELQQLGTLTKEWITPRYTPSFRAANIIRISPRALSKISSSFLISSTTGGERYNIGLDMKFDARGFKVVDFTRKPWRQWEYSDRAITLIEEYKVKFPQVFKCLDKNENGIPTASDIFGEYELEAKIKELVDWLKEKGIPEFQKVPIATQYERLSTDHIRELENFQSTILISRSPEVVQAKSFDRISTTAVLKPEYTAYRLTRQTFSLGDRVRMVRSSGPVPFFMKGFVIGIAGNYLEVLWDEPLLTGSTLDERRSSNRAMAVNSTSCLNISNPQFIQSLAQLSPTASPFVPYHSPRTYSKPLSIPNPGSSSSTASSPAPHTRNDNRYLPFSVGEQNSQCGPQHSALDFHQGRTIARGDLETSNSTGNWQTVGKKTRPDSRLHPSPAPISRTDGDFTSPRGGANGRGARGMSGRRGKIAGLRGRGSGMIM